MNTTVKRLVITATLVGSAVGAALVPSPSSAITLGPARLAPSAKAHAWTPNDCIRLNGGDFNACNVGNSGRGDLPYKPIAEGAQFRMS